jgi:D-alanyl-D-alanine carboxypeptidase/D-alanyl-D-alanine-endopeptidase (penicillin-binding protein 4)
MTMIIISRNIIYSFVFFIAFGCAGSDRIATPPQAKPFVEERIDAILADSIFSGVSIGIDVVNLLSNTTVYERNSNKLLRPASNLKLFTTASALELLPKDFEFKTQVLIDGEVNDVTLNGDLYLKGYGDPLLTAENLDTLAEKVSRQIKTINGNLICDISHFDDNYWGKGWAWDDEPEYFDASISPLSVNSNIIKVFITPGENIGDTAIIRIEPTTDLIQISNFAVTSNSLLPSQLSVTRNWKGRDNRIIVTGSTPLQSKEGNFSLSIWKPELFALNLFKEKLELHGLTIQGKTFIDSISQGKLLFQTNHLLDSVIININKISNNLAAENLLKTIGAELFGKPGSADAGITLMKQFISHIGIDTTKIIIADGSGVSRYNLISPQNITTLLRHIYNDKKYFNRFYSSLSIGGVDGSLKNRFTNGAVRNNIHAKTGTHSDGLALSGYLNAAKGDILAFSIIVNNFTGNSKQYRDIIDNICELLVNYR